MGGPVSTVEQLSAALDGLSASEAEELAALLRLRAERLRRRVSVEQARAAVHGAEISEAWQRSQLADVGRLRRAACELTLAGWRAEQIAGPLGEVGLDDVFPDEEVVAMAIRAGIDDGRRLRGSR